MARARQADGRGQHGVIEVTNLTVRFAGVTPIDSMSVTFATRYQLTWPWTHRRESLQGSHRTSHDGLRCVTSGT